MDRKIEEIKISRRHRKDLGNIAELAESIDGVGLLHPIVVTPKNLLIAGRRRLQAAKNLGWKNVPVHVVDLEKVAQGEYAENTFRKAFSPSEEVSIVRALRPEEEASAQERKQASLKRGAESPRGGKLPQREKGKTRDKVAKAVGRSGRTLEKAEAVVDAAEEDPERFGPLQEEMDRTGRVNGVFRKLNEALGRPIATLEEVPE